ncbi:MAG: anaerobic ribonucleoside-triphosphate reductase activating protein [Spirochaetaceae bacterium]|jgi:pyruvate formate lyase activating enzyme|nr:anaerobic ribonucleoside-triphosphate reductase activating protein [Spirochaetaceae bacterium]
MKSTIKVAFEKTSFNDYPAKIASVIFFPACNLRCPWCHNGALITGRQNDGLIPLSAALEHIKKRSKLIGGVVISGGEPTLFTGLAELSAYLKSLGLLVKLDTNGLMPNVLRALVADERCRPDFFAMDLKCAPGRYGGLVPAGDIDTADSVAGRLTESARIIRESGAAYEFRSLVFPPDSPPLHTETGGHLRGRRFFDMEDIHALRPLAPDGHWRFRRFRAGNCLDERWNTLPDTDSEELARVCAYGGTGTGGIGNTEDGAV